MTRRLTVEVIVDRCDEALTEWDDFSAKELLAKMANAVALDDFYVESAKLVDVEG
jgi:hypothetical protein